MGRPKELTEEQRADLLARGYRPKEIWVSPTGNGDFWSEIEAECREIGAADENAEVVLFTEQAAQDVFRLINEEEEAMGQW